MTDHLARKGFRVQRPPISEEEAARVAASNERRAKEHQAYLTRQAESERKQREEAEREAAEREAKRVERLAAEKARDEAYNAARAREDAESPLGHFGPQNTGRDIRICLAKLYIDLWYDVATDVERLSGPEIDLNGVEINKSSIGDLLIRLNNRWPKFRPPIGLLERTIHEKAQTTRRNGAAEFVDTCEPSKEGTGLSSWLIRGLGVEDTPLNRGVSRAWMIDAVRCARHPEMAPSLALALEGCDPLHVVNALALHSPPMRDFLLRKMISGPKGKHRTVRILRMRCGRVDLAALRHNAEGRWHEAASHEAAGESVDLETQIEVANAAFERTTNPFFAVLEAFLDGVEGKIRTADVAQVLGLDSGELANNRDPRNGMINRAMELLGWGKRRAVRWGCEVSKGWSNGASTLSLELEKAEDGSWRIRRG